MTSTLTEANALASAAHDYFGGDYVPPGAGADQEMVGASVAFRAGWARASEWHATPGLQSPEECGSLIPFVWHEQIRCELPPGHDGEHWCDDTGWSNDRPAQPTRDTKEGRR